MSGSRNLAKLSSVSTHCRRVPEMGGRAPVAPTRLIRRKRAVIIAHGRNGEYTENALEAGECDDRRWPPKHLPRAAADRGAGRGGEALHQGSDSAWAAMGHAGAERDAQDMLQPPGDGDGDGDRDGAGDFASPADEARAAAERATASVDDEMDPIEANEEWHAAMESEGMKGPDDNSGARRSEHPQRRIRGVCAGCRAFQETRAASERTRRSCRRARRSRRETPDTPSIRCQAIPGTAHRATPCRMAPAEWRAASRRAAPAAGA